MNVVLDTNILVSALLSPFGTPAQVLNIILAGEAALVYDDRILAEYGDVLKRRKFGFDQGLIASLLGYVVHEGLAVSALPVPVSLPDPDDLPFLEVASVARALLVTGNLRHFPPDLCRGVTVLTARDFLTHWQEHH